MVSEPAMAVHLQAAPSTPYPYPYTPYANPTPTPTPTPTPIPNQVIRPSTHAALFRYFAPLVAESQRVLAALPSDGAHDPKVRLRG